MVPVPTRLGRDLQRATERNITAVRDDVGTRISAGPIGILLVGAPGRTSYALAGTVTPEGLAQAAAELPDGGGWR